MNAFTPPSHRLVALALLAMLAASLVAAQGRSVQVGYCTSLANLEAVVPAVQILTDPDGFQFSNRKVTVSTSGLVPEMEELGRSVTVNLAVSLNATTDEVRDRIMPVSADGLVVRTSTLGDDVGLMGAAVLVLSGVLGVS